MVDEELLRLDVINALRARNVIPSRPIRRALWRGPHGKVRCWLAELDGASCGLLAKLASRYAWTEGSRDEMLATLPDDCFEAAARALA